MTQHVYTDPPESVHRRGSTLGDSARNGVSVEYINEAVIKADVIKCRTMPGDAEYDLAEYTERLIQEVYALRDRVAYLEGWKEGTERHHTSDVSTQRDELEKRTR